MHSQRKDKERKVSDVRWPSAEKRASDVPIPAHFSARHDKPNLSSDEEKNTEKPLNKKAFIGVFLLVCALVVLVAVFFRETSIKLSKPALQGEDEFSAAMKKFTGLSLGGDGGTFGDIFGAFGELFAGAGESVAGITGIAGKFIGLAEDVQYIETNLASLLMQKKGGVLISRLESISGHLKEIRAEEDHLAATAAKLNSAVPGSAGSYLSLQLNLLETEKLVDSLLAWLKKETPRHILVLLQNPSEIRPAGGFLGSYADVVIKRGNVESVDIRDISDADKVLELKTIPPVPLQAIVKNWRTADANWFFDFPQSAAAVIGMIESSALYADKGILFDGAIAVSPKVIEDILEIVGPVTVGEKTMTRGNFFLEIQKEVQAGHARAGSGGQAPSTGSGQATYPKGILKDLAAKILEKALVLDESEIGGFFDIAGSWVEQRDAMIYFKDDDLENLAGEYGASGEVYEFTRDFLGDYVALVEANIGGGKSDLLVKRRVVFESQINTDGTVDNRVVLGLEHKGNQSEYWWQKVPSQLYVQLFVPASSRLTGSSGGIEKKIAAQIDYKKNGYRSDSRVSEIESGIEKNSAYPAILEHKELSRKVFSTWSNLKPGEKKEIVFDYNHRLFLSPADGQIYTLVFEKQAGTIRDYEFSVSAPQGFVFEENNLPIFKYDSSGPPGMLVVNLTLKEFAGD